MNTIYFTSLLSVIFILHNFEEYMSHDKFPEVYFKFLGDKFRNIKVFLYATTFLDVLVILILAFNYFINNTITLFLSTIIFFSISINGIQHCISSIILKKFSPGAITSIFLIVPFLIISIVKLKNEIFLSGKYVVLCIILSIIVIWALIFISMWLGFLLSKIIKNERAK